MCPYCNTCSSSDESYNVRSFCYICTTTLYYVVVYIHHYLQRSKENIVRFKRLAKNWDINCIRKSAKAQYLLRYTTIIQAIYSQTADEKGNTIYIEKSLRLSLPPHDTTISLCLASNHVQIKQMRSLLDILWYCF